MARLENADRPEGTDYRPMFHYPTMYQRGCTLLVVYTVSFNIAGTMPSSASLGGIQTGESGQRPSMSARPSAHLFIGP